jgi:hypothetical protein
MKNLQEMDYRVGSHSTSAIGYLFESLLQYQ